MIHLLKPWGGRKAGAELRVLEPREPIKGACVDAARAAQLVADGIAGEGRAPKKASKPKRGDS